MPKTESSKKKLADLGSANLNREKEKIANRSIEAGSSSSQSPESYGPTIFTTKTLADRWHCCESKIEKDRVYGKGPRFFYVGRSVRYRLKDIEQFEKEQLRTSTSEG